jgi:hypothetical protein
MDFTRSSQSTQKGKIHFASRRESSAVGFNGARWSTARSRESYLPSFYRQPGRTKAVAWAPSHHTVTAWTRHGPGAATCSGAGPITVARPLAGRRQGRFARPVDVECVVMEDWVWASVRRPWDRRSPRGTGVRARLAGGAAWRDHAHDVARGRERVVLPPSRN